MQAIHHGFLCTVVCSLLLSTAHADDPQSAVVVRHKELDDGQYQLLAENSGSGDATVIVDLTLTNMTSSAGRHVVANLKPHSETVLCMLKRKISNSRSRFRYLTKWYWGQHGKQHDHSYVYQLPFGAGERFLVGQAYSGSQGGTTTHKGWQRYAIDFRMPEGTPVHAAREGTVVDMATHYDKGGTSTYYADKANYICIIHSDGSIGKYLHLLKHGAEVTVGETVSRGQRIGVSGNTGRSWRPHLHFHVQTIDEDGQRMTVPTSFNTTYGHQQLKGYTVYSRPR